MKQTHTKFIISLLSLGLGSSLLGAVSLSFPVDSGFVGPTRLNLGTSIDFAFTVDGSGNVTLDATTSSANGDSIAAVNGWDGAVGTVSDAAVFGTSFTLSMTSGRRNNAQTAFDSVAVSGDGFQGGGTVGVFGQNASVIDGSSLANNNIERIRLAVTSGTVAVALNEFKFTGGNNSDPTVATDSASMNYFNHGLTAGVGTVDTSADGLSFTNGGYLGFEILKEEAAGDFTEGYRLNGMTFDFTSPVPEPGSLLLTGVGLLGLMVRRR